MLVFSSFSNAEDINLPFLILLKVSVFIKDAYYWWTGCDSIEHFCSFARHIKLMKLWRNDVFSSNLRAAYKIQEYCLNKKLTKEWQGKTINIQKGPDRSVIIYMIFRWSLNHACRTKFCKWNKEAWTNKMLQIWSWIQTLIYSKIIKLTFNFSNVN